MRTKGRAGGKLQRKQKDYDEEKNLRTLNMVKMLPTKRLFQHERKLTRNYTKDFQPPSHSAVVDNKIYGDETQKFDAESDMTTAESN